MKTKQKVEKAEFYVTDGTSRTNVMWSKEGTKWSVTLYKHGCNPRYISTVGQLPSVANALFFQKKYPLMSTDDIEFMNRKSMGR